MELCPIFKEINRLRMVTLGQDPTQPRIMFILLQLNEGLSYCLHLDFQCEMNYNPEMDSTPGIQIMGLEDTSF